MNNYLDDLNQDQLEAVKTIDKPLRIIAGAGSGKTKVICSKILYLINDCNIYENSILAITFTNKACNEIKYRIENSINRKISNIHTFHGLGAKILRDDAKYIGLTPNFTIIDTSEQLKILKDIVKKEDINNYKTYDFKKLVSFIRNWKNSECLKNNQAIEITEDIQKEYHLYKIYELYLKNNNMVDFDDLLIKPIKIFEQNINIKEKWINYFKYILVDEYQDTNKIQDRLINLIINKRSNITVVGDPDQNIYSWRGADLTLMLDFERERNNAKTIFLNKNYRSKQQILDVANDLIEKNVNRVKKNIFSKMDDGEKITFTSFETKVDEAKYVVEKIASLVKKGLFNFSDFFVLYRNNSWSNEIQNQFDRKKIPYVVYGSTAFKERKVVKDLYSMLRCLIIKDSTELYWDRFLELLPNIGKRSIQNIKELISINKITYYDFFSNHSDLLIDKNSKFIIISQAIKKLEVLLKQDLKMNEIVDFLIDFFNFRSIYDNGSNESKDNLELINIFLEQIIDFDNEVCKEIPILYDRFLLYLQESVLQTQEKYINSNEKVVLSTIHSVKGLESKYVFLCGFNDNLIPGNFCYDKNNLEEERRLLYVAITRAKKKFEFTHVMNATINGCQLSSNPSRFLYDIREDLIEFKNININLQNNKIVTKPFESNLYKPNEVIKKNINVNDIIEHKFFGQGIVTEVNDFHMKVLFNQTNQIKIINLNTNVWIKKSDTI